jgi:exopolysaccharide biosynthesis polyprenyl glycosylphosphotransferase
MNKKLQAVKYIFADFISAATAWTLFYIFRKLYLEPQKFGYQVGIEFNTKFYYGLLLVPVFWIIFYTLTGYYNEPYRKSRLTELWHTFISSVLGVVAIFFTLLLDDEIATYKSYYNSVITLFSLHFFTTFLFRLILTSRTAHRIHNRKIGFNTLLIGSNDNALNLFKELESQKKSSGFNFKGYLHINGNHNHLLEPHLPHLGGVKEIKQVIKEKSIEEVIIAIESSEHENIKKIINELEGENVYVKVIPDMYDILSGHVKMTSIFGAPLIEIKHQIMPLWQQAFKRAFDIVISAIVLTLFFPILFTIGLIVALTSKGPAIYTHERIGRYGKPFKIYKFRSMYTDAEKNGPALSSKEDKRITPFGRFLRKSRMDELPQFYNVLIGEMSIVGPRPERQFFIDQIIKQAPHYSHLHKVRPGITSWGQVKYGYAENVDQMIARLKYDIIYIENMSLYYFNSFAGQRKIIKTKIYYYYYE